MTACVRRVALLSDWIKVKSVETDCWCYIIHYTASTPYRTACNNDYKVGEVDASIKRHR